MPQAVAIGAKRTPRLDDPAEILLKLRCAIKDERTEAVYPTNAGLLLFGKAPDEFLTQAEIVAAYYQDSSGLARHTSRKVFTGTIDKQIDQAAAILNIWNSRAREQIEGFRRIDEVELPLEALREAVVNAVVHQDYSKAGTAVRIFFLPRPGRNL